MKLVVQHTWQGRTRPAGTVIDVTEAEAKGLVEAGVAVRLAPRGNGGCRNCGRPR
jgi:hypothetical protein